MTGYLETAGDLETGGELGMGGQRKAAGQRGKRRRRGAAAGLLLAVLGLWGALVPFVGPYFHYAYTPATAWAYTPGRVYLEVAPGAGALLGGLLLRSAGRGTALSGGLLAAAAGGWFVLGTTVIPLWSRAPLAGSPAGSTTAARIAEQAGFFTGLGVVIVFVAALAIGAVAAAPAGPQAQSPSGPPVPAGAAKADLAFKAPRGESTSAASHE